MIFNSEPLPERIQEAMKHVSTAEVLSGCSAWQLLTALLVLTCIGRIGAEDRTSMMGRAEVDLTFVSKTDAVFACQPWLDKMAARQPTQCSDPQNDSRSPLDWVYEVITADGQHKFQVNALTGQVKFYVNMSAERKALQPGIQGEGHAMADLVMKQEQVWRRLFDFFDLNQTKLINHQWHEFVSADVLSGNSFTIRFVPGSADVWYLGFTHREVDIGITPTLGAEERQRRAIAAAMLEAKGMDVALSRDSLERLFGTRYLTVYSDDSGVQRLGQFVPLVESPKRAGAAGSTQVRQHHLLFVDAVNGECLDPDFDVRGSRLVGDEHAPALYIGNREIDRYGPMFPPRIRDGVVYLYVGYLQSLIWRGSVRCSPTEIKVSYAEHEWHFRLDRTTAMRDGREHSFKSTPRQIAGYCYLPAEIIEAITTWSVEYVAKDNVVYVYTRLSKAPSKP